MTYHFCPVCRRQSCGHLLAAPVKRDDIFDSLKRAAQTPLDLGVARFTAEVVALLR
jgi:hypothetical protein